MKKLIVNNTVLLFLGLDDFNNYQNRDLLKLKNDYLLHYDNCIIYNYFDLKNHKELIRDKINKLKYINQIKINARECTILETDTNNKKNFLNNNHLQGNDRSQISIVAKHNDDIVSIMTFDISNSFNGGLKENEYLLSRFAIKKGHIIVGIFNKLLKYFIKNYNPLKIISYADLNYSLRNNNIYLYNNFMLEKTIKPDYKYYNKLTDKIYHKFTYGSKYKRNTKISNLEKENTYNNLTKIWNCGKICYIMNIINNTPIFGYIYKIENKVNGKVYIGQTTRIFIKRLYEYKSNYNNNKYNNQYLGNAFNKYGWENFNFNVIDNAKNINELNQKEIHYINKFKSNNKEFGYNIEGGGLNSIPSTITTEKMSKSHLGIKQTENWVNKRISKAGTEDAKKYGKAKTEEDKKILSENSAKYWQGKTRSDETKKKISQSKKMKGISENFKKKICKKVYRINLTDNNITEYTSTNDASKIIGVNQSTISRWCKNNTKKDGFLWTYNANIN